jgi:cytochrome P450
MLARLEMRIVLGELLRRTPSLHIADPESVSVKWTVAREFGKLHYTWTPKAASVPANWKTEGN